MWKLVSNTTTVPYQKGFLDWTVQPMIQFHDNGKPKHHVQLEILISDHKDHRKILTFQARQQDSP